MEKLFLFLLVSILFTASESEIETKFRSEDISNGISGDDETCSYGMAMWMEYPTSYMQNVMDVMFSSWSKGYAEPTFHCYSRKNVREADYVTNSNFSSWDTSLCNVYSTRKTIFIVHGYKDANAPWTRDMKDALILREDCTVFIVEFGHSSETYSQIFENVPEIGKQVATFIRSLMKLKDLDLQHVHIIGHSIGAQISGFVGMEIKMTEEKSVGRITGLDPAGPGFYGVTPDLRLDETDASFVDIIHTNRGCHRLEGMGTSDVSGHFDFYPNGGQMQPGCLTASEFLSEMDFSLAKSTFKYLFGTLEQSELQILLRMLCSHVRSYEFFTASLLDVDCKFTSVQCSIWKDYVSGRCNGNDKVVMGYYADGYKNIAEDGTHKKFYLETAADRPYCI